MFGREKQEHPSEKIEPVNAAEAPRNFHPREFWSLVVLTALFFGYLIYCYFTTPGYEYYIQIIAVVSIWVLIIGSMVIKIKQDLFIAAKLTDDHMEDAVELLSLPLHQREQWDIKANVAFINKDTGTRVYFVEEIDEQKRTITASRHVKFNSMSFMTQKGNDIELRKENDWLWDKVTWLSFQLPIESKRIAVRYLMELNQVLFGHTEIIKPHYYWKDVKMDEKGTRLPSLLRGDIDDMEGDEQAKEDYKKYREELKSEYEKSKKREYLPEKYKKKPEGED